MQATSVNHCLEVFKIKEKSSKVLHTVADKYNILTLGTAERQTIFFASESTLKNIADVSGDNAFTCFRAPSSACK